MAKKKATTKNLKAKPVSKREKAVEEKSVLNLNSQITTSLGKFKIRKLPAFDLLELIGNYIEPISVLFDENEVQLFKNLATSKDLRNAICEIFALFYNEEDHGIFAEATIQDLTELIKGVKTVFSMEDIEQLFLALGLQKFLKTVTSTLADKQ